MGKSTKCNSGDFECFDPDNLVVVGIIALILVIIGFIIEFSFSQGKKLWKRWKFPQEFLHAVFQELTVLGLFSFLFFLVTNDHLWDLGEDVDEVIEFLHMVLFLSTICYVILVVIVFLRYIWWKRQLFVLEKRDIAPKGRFLLFYYPFIRPIISWTHFHSLRAGFIKQHRKILGATGDILHLSTTKDFSFAQYLNESIVEKLVEMAELPYYLWLCVLPLITAVFIYAYEIERDNLALAAIYTYIALEGLSVLCAIIIVIKLHLLLRKLSLNYDQYSTGIKLLHYSTQYINSPNSDIISRRYSMEPDYAPDDSRSSRRITDSYRGDIITDDNRDGIQYEPFEDQYHSKSLIESITSKLTVTKSKSSTSSISYRRNLQIQRKRKGNLSSCYLPRDYYSLFWFRSTSFIRSFMQVLLLLQAVGVALYVTGGGTIYKSIGYFGFILIVGCAILVLVLLIGFALPVYFIVTSVGPNSKIIDDGEDEEEIKIIEEET